MPTSERIAALGLGGKGYLRAAKDFADCSSACSAANQAFGVQRDLEGLCRHVRGDGGVRDDGEGQSVCRFGRGVRTGDGPVVRALKLIPRRGLHGDHGVAGNGGEVRDGLVVHISGQVFAQSQLVGVALELAVELNAAVGHLDGEGFLAAVHRGLSVHMILPAGEVPAHSGLGGEGDLIVGGVSVAILEVGVFIGNDLVDHGLTFGRRIGGQRRDGQRVLLAPEGNDSLGACFGLDDRQGILARAALDRYIVQSPTVHLVAAVGLGAEDDGLADGGRRCVLWAGHGDGAVGGLTVRHFCAHTVGGTRDKQLCRGQGQVVVFEEERIYPFGIISGYESNGIEARLNLVGGEQAPRCVVNHRSHDLIRLFRSVPIDETLNLQHAIDFVVKVGELAVFIDLIDRPGHVRETGNSQSLRGNSDHCQVAVVIRFHDGSVGDPAGKIVLEALFDCVCGIRIVVGGIFERNRKSPAARIDRFPAGDVSVRIDRILHEIQLITVGVAVLRVDEGLAAGDALGVEPRRCRIIACGQEDLAPAVVRGDLVDARDRSDCHGCGALGVQLGGVGGLGPAGLQGKTDRSGGDGGDVLALHGCGNGAAVDGQIRDLSLALGKGHGDLGGVGRYQVLVSQRADLAAVDALNARTGILEGKVGLILSLDVLPAAAGSLLLPLVIDLCTGGQILLIGDVCGNPGHGVREGVQHGGADGYLRHAGLGLGVGAQGLAGDAGIGLGQTDGLNAVLIARVGAEALVDVLIVLHTIVAFRIRAALDRADLIEAGGRRGLEVAIEHEARRVAGIVPFQRNLGSGGLLLVRTEVFRQQGRRLHIGDKIRHHRVTILIQEAHQPPVEGISIPLCLGGQAVHRAGVAGPGGGNMDLARAVAVTRGDAYLHAAHARAGLGLNSELIVKAVFLFAGHGDGLLLGVLAALADGGGVSVECQRLRPSGGQTADAGGVAAGVTHGVGEGAADVRQNVAVGRPDLLVFLQRDRLDGRLVGDVDCHGLGGAVGHGGLIDIGLDGHGVEDNGVQSGHGGIGHLIFQGGGLLGLPGEGVVDGELRLGGGQLHAEDGPGLFPAGVHAHGEGVGVGRAGAGALGGPVGRGGLDHLAVIVAVGQIRVVGRRGQHGQHLGIGVGVIVLAGVSEDGGVVVRVGQGEGQGGVVPDIIVLVAVIGSLCINRLCAIAVRAFGKIDARQEIIILIDRGEGLLEQLLDVLSICHFCGISQGEQEVLPAAGQICRPRAPLYVRAILIELLGQQIKNIKAVAAILDDDTIEVDAGGLADAVELADGDVGGRKGHAVILVFILDVLPGTHAVLFLKEIEVLLCDDFKALVGPFVDGEVTGIIGGVG